MRQHLDSEGFVAVGLAQSDLALPRCPPPKAFLSALNWNDWMKTGFAIAVWSFAAMPGDGLAGDERV